MKTIPLTRGQVTLVDDADFDVLSRYKWHLESRQGKWLYAVRTVRGGSKIRMHRMIAGASDDAEVDHWDNDGLNNQRSNLRVTDRSGNQQNRQRLWSNTTGFRGVTFLPKTQRWQAQIKRHRTNHHLGVHGSPEDAARAYDEAAIRLYGLDARTNFERISV